MTTPTNPEPENKMPELLPCPFCGATEEERDGVKGTNHHEECYLILMETELPNSPLRIMAWNSRTDIVQELREQLEHALNPIHTCGEQCQRPACVMRRERDRLLAKTQRLEKEIEELEKENEVLNSSMSAIRDSL